MTFDLVILNGTVVDGTGQARRPASIGLQGDKITAIGDLKGASANRIIDATGLFVTPGFIDVHTHSDTSILINPRLESKVRQGVTTEILGNCGSSLAPALGLAADSIRKELERSELSLCWSSLGEYVAFMGSQGPSINFGTLVGHGTLREAVMGYAMRPPNGEELTAMEHLLEDSLREGALGLSSGLVYPPSSYAQEDELVTLCRVVAKYDGLYATHIRNESGKLLAAVEEAIEIGERSGAAVEIAHHKAAGRRHWGKVELSLELIDRACKRGCRVACDQYPYIASSTGLGSLLPTWAYEGGTGKMLERLRDPLSREKIAAEIIYKRSSQANGDESTWDKVMISGCRSDHTYEGLRLTQIASKAGKNPVETIIDLLLANYGAVGCVFFSMCEEDVRTVMRYPHTIAGSDSAARANYGKLGQGKPHPRAYGTFPRLLGHYVRQEGVLTWEEAVAKMTGMSAARFGLKGRGLIAEGYYADLVIFDPNEVADQATYSDPHQYPKGIDHVIVNGAITVERGEHTGAMAGRVVTR